LLNRGNWTFVYRGELRREGRYVMSTSMIMGIIVVALAVTGIAVWYGIELRRRTNALRTQYGSEYDRTVRKANNRRDAEAELVKRRARVDHFEIRPLLAEQRELFDQQWRDVQEMFVDDPARAINRADLLVVEVMRTRGYPVATFEQRAADLSVHHSAFVRNYRAARDVTERHRRGTATTEELRRAMLYYHEMFDDLLGPEPSTTDRPVAMIVAREVAPPAITDRQFQKPRRSFDSLFPPDDEAR
jgi:hypothetical protein